MIKIISLIIVIFGCVNTKQISGLNERYALSDTEGKDLSFIQDNANMWDMYIKQILYESIYRCMDLGTHLLHTCHPLVRQFEGILNNVYDLILSLSYSRMYCKSPDIMDYYYWKKRKYAQIVNRFSSFVGMVRYRGSCATTWTIQISPLFSLNITIHHAQFALQGQAGEYVHLNISQVQPNYVGNSQLFQGRPIRGSVYIPGYGVIMTLRNVYQAPINIDVTFECMDKIPRTKMHTKYISGGQYLFWGREYNLEMFNNLEQSIRNIMAVSEKSSTLNVMVTVQLMSTIYIQFDMCCSNDTSLLPGIFADGPMPTYDAVTNFNHTLIKFNNAKNNMSNNKYTTSLNHATLLLRKYTSLSKFIMNAKFDIKRQRCPSRTCLSKEMEITPGRSIHEYIKMDQTAVYNLTYVMAHGSDLQIAVKITRLSIDGYYIPDCPYGSVTVAYKESIHQDYHILLGTYCSLGAISGLLSLAKPLHLAQGSLSIIFKNYQHVSQIHMEYVIETDLCKGIVDEYFLSTYDTAQLSTEFTGTLPHYNINGPFQHLIFFPPLFFSYYETYEIKRRDRYCIYYQCMPSDNLVGHSYTTNYRSESLLHELMMASEIPANGQTESRTTSSTYTVELIDANYLLPTVLCGLGYFVDTYCMDNMYITYSKLNIHIDSQNGTDRLNLNLGESIGIMKFSAVKLSFSGRVSGCRWLGLGLRIKLEANKEQCQILKLLPSYTYALFDWCFHMRMIHTNKQVHGDDNSKYVVVT